MCVKDNAESDATGMLKTYPVVCVRANQAFNAHLRGVSAIFCVGITLLVNTQGCGRPQIADGHKVDTHAFCCVVNQ